MVNVEADGKRVAPAAAGRTPRAWLLGLAVFCALPHLVPPWTVNHDVAWYLYAAGRVLDGARPYVDVIDLNPPLALYLHLVPAALARWLGVPPAAAFEACVLAWIGTGLLLCRAMLVGMELPAAVRRFFPAALVVAFLAAPGYDFGQREHLLSVASMPYALLVVRRLQGLPVDRRTAVAIGLFAGLGVALKPHHLLSFALLELSLAVGWRRVRALARAESIALAVVLLAYAGHFALLPAEVRAAWTRTLETVLATYRGFELPWRELLGFPGAWAVVGLGLTALASLRFGGASRELAKTLALLWLAAFAAAALQRKGWVYHFLPALIAGALGLATILLNVLDRHLRGAAGTAAAWVVLFGLTAWAVLERPAGAAWPALREPGRASLALVEPVLRLAGGGPVAALDTSLNPYFMVLLQAELDWSLRYPFLYPLPAIYGDVPPEARDVPYRSPQDRGAIEQTLVDAIVEDLRTHPPSLVLVRRAPQYRMRNRHFDLVAWLERDPRFEELWRGFERVQSLPGHDIWVRRP